jgi:universal stress protein E
MNAPVRSIIAATDFSAAAERGLDRAARLAREQGAELVLVHAVEAGDWLSLPGLPVGLSEDYRRAATFALERERDRVGAGIACRTILVDGALHRALPALLDAQVADLLVLGGRGAGDWADAVLGSTADRVLRLQRVPVLLARVAPTNAYARVVLATDFSIASEQAAAFALGIVPDATCLLAHVNEPLFEGTLAFAGVSDDLIADYRLQTAANAMRDLQAQAARLGEAGAKPIPALRQGRASRELPALVVAENADLVVVGAQGRSRIEVGLLGSVSRHLASCLGCDVLVVPQR